MMPITIVCKREAVLPNHIWLILIQPLKRRFAKLKTRNTKKNENYCLSSTTSRKLLLSHCKLSTGYLVADSYQPTAECKSSDLVVQARMYSKLCKKRFSFNGRFVQIFDCRFPWFSRTKLFYFPKLFKVFYICLYKQNTLKTFLNAKHKFNTKH